MLEIVVVDGEEVVTTESIKQSTLIGAEASQRGLCFHCAAFRGRANRSSHGAHCAGRAPRPPLEWHRRKAAAFP